MHDAPDAHARGNAAATVSAMRRAARVDLRRGISS